MRIPELLLPAGSFDGGIAAFEGGADAVYLGMKRFSARKQARNFDELEYRRMLAYAREKTKKIYVAINTVITESELPELTNLLGFLARFVPDAVIFQDWAVAGLIRERYPDLHLHASTQMALQSTAAAGLVAEQGVERIVLPRETSPLELAELTESNPDLEFEVFVHGALCYSFSGLCLASGMLLGRSGNRGECAQVCRSWYQGTGQGLAGQGYWFSCRDLSLVDHVRELAEARAACLKVEGRMKTPEYALSVARLFRGALDRLTGTGPTDEEMAERLRQARLSFARSPTIGYAGHHAGSSILDVSFPGHRGIPLGEIEDAAGDGFVVRLETPLVVRDGLQIVESRDGTIARSLQFSALELRDEESGKRIIRAEPGSRVRIPFPGNERDGRDLIGRGVGLSRISSRDLDRRGRSQEEFPPLLSDVRAVLSVGEYKDGKAFFILECTIPRSGGQDASFRLVDDQSITIDKARQAGGFLKALEVFNESGSFDFRLVVELSAVFSACCPDFPAIDAVDLFVPPSELKKLKNRMYDRAMDSIRELEAAFSLGSLACDPFPSPAILGQNSLRRGEVPPRASIVFRDARVPGGMPFATPGLVKSRAPLPEVLGFRWLPLAPLVADTEAYMASIATLTESMLAEGVPIMIGIDAIHHVALARKLVTSAALEDRSHLLGFYGDIHLYMANPLTLAYYSRVIPRLLFAYRWIEGEKSSGPQESPGSAANPDHPPLVDVGPGFNPPLFLSKACLLRHHIGGGSCPVPCGKKMNSTVKDRERRYVTLVEDCISMMFAIPE